MKHLFVSKEISISLKELGYDEPSIFVYRGHDLYCMDSGYLSNFELNTNSGTNDVTNHWTLAPMYQQVIDWFREKHNIDINLYNADSRTGYVYRLTSTIDDRMWLGGDGNFPYYQALEEGIKEAIEFIKKHK